MTNDLADTLERLQDALSHRYVVNQQVGRGGTSVVYRAFDTQLHRDVAIKVLLPEFTATIGADRFHREIQIAARLQHPHILPLHDDSGPAGDLLYYTMPYVEGESLAHRLKRQRQLSVVEAVRIAREIASALAYAHAHDVVHRDIKPENVLLSSEQAIVADFGIARAIIAAGGDRVTSGGMAIGTAAYMSPEQAGGESELDGRSDIYSLGCVLFEMLAGEPPFTGPNAQAIVARHMFEPPRSLRIVRPDMPARLDDVIAKALAKVPADRFDTADAFADAILEATVDRNIVVQGVDRRRVVGRAIGGAALAAASLLGAWLWFRPDLPVLDANKVVVFPLVERGSQPGARGTGEDVALMIGAALEHTEPLKWIDGWQHLEERQRENTSLLSARAARTIARERRARYYLDGVVRHHSDSVAVILRLHDALADSLISQETAAAPAGTIPMHQLGLATVRRLIPKLLVPDRPIDFGPLTDRRPASIALWIQGEREYRRARFAEALGFYRRAVREDSGLVLAAVKGAQAAQALHHSSEVHDFLKAALRDEARLPRRYRFLVRGLDAHFAGRADSAIMWLERAVREDTGWGEAWMALAETYYHLLPSRTPLDSLAEAAFRATLAADTAFTPAMLHLVEISARRGETRRAMQMMNRLRAVDPDSVVERYLELMLQCVERGPHGVDWAATVGGDLRPVLTAARLLSGAGARPECAEAGFRATLAGTGVPGYRWAALVGLQGLLAAQGRTAEVVQLLDSAVAAGTYQALWLYIIDAEAGLPVRHKAARMEPLARARYGDAYQRAGPHIQWLLALWFVRSGDLARTETLHTALAARGAQREGRLATLLADAVGAHLRLAHADTAGAIDQFRALKPTALRDTLVWSLWDALAVERLQLARLLMTRGQYEEALRVASAFDHTHPISYLPFLFASLRLRLDAARALGKHQLADAYKARLAKLRRIHVAEVP